MLWLLQEIDNSFTVSAEALSTPEDISMCFCRLAFCSWALSMAYWPMSIVWQHQDSICNLRPCCCGLHLLTASLYVYSLPVHKLALSMSNYEAWQAFNTVLSSTGAGWHWCLAACITKPLASLLLQAKVADMNWSVGSSCRMIKNMYSMFRNHRQYVAFSKMTDRQGDIAHMPCPCPVPCAVLQAQMTREVSLTHNSNKSP